MSDYNGYNDFCDNTDYDYDGDMGIFQRQLDAAGINYDITMLAGCTEREIRGTVNYLLLAHKKKTGQAVEA